MVMMIMMMIILQVMVMRNLPRIKILGDEAENEY